MGATNTFLGWYLREESIMKEMEEIHRALICGIDAYELKYSTKKRKSFLFIKAIQWLLVSQEMKVELLYKKDP